MYIYSICPKNDKKEIYIGKTNDLTQRIYAHKSCTLNGNKQRKYVWMREVGWENLEFKIEEEYFDLSVDKEAIYINKYIESGYEVFNDQLNNYHPPLKPTFNAREEVWKDYSQNAMTRKQICDKYLISDSLLSKIIIEHGGSVRKDKLYKYYEIIKCEIMCGCSIRSLAKKYNVCQNSIRNINVGITAYDPHLNYPLNQYVVSEIVKNSYFKPKV